ncbi:MAG: N-acetylmuramoyl-L-alanine amidase, partial [Clostridia bacterium]|nr:N-acetylmuramoyl-L-alanine amidase [Clostridia bacterium]
MSSVNKAGVEFTFVIDAGHGGVDGGAVGINGALEKDINLSLSFILADVLKVMGYNTVMTRQTDELLGEHTKGQMKL